MGSNWLFSIPASSRALFTTVRSARTRISTNGTSLFIAGWEFFAREISSAVVKTWRANLMIGEEGG